MTQQLSDASSLERLAEDLLKLADGLEVMTFLNCGALLREAAEAIKAREAAEQVLREYFIEGWKIGYYDGGDHDCRMFKPTAERAWGDFCLLRKKSLA